MGDLSKEDAGVIVALVARFEKQRLPRLLSMKERVGNGELLSDEDVGFLHKVLEDANKTMPFTEGHQQLHEFCAHVVHLYKEITEKALENLQKHQ